MDFLIVLKGDALQNTKLDELKSSLSLLAALCQVDPEDAGSAHVLLVRLVLSLAARQWWWWPEQWPGGRTSGGADRALAGEGWVSTERAEESLPCYIPGNAGRALLSSGFKGHWIYKLSRRLYLGHEDIGKSWGACCGFRVDPELILRPTAGCGWADGTSLVLCTQEQNSLAVWIPEWKSNLVFFFLFGWQNPASVKWSGYFHVVI